jgi:hypothetical protein
VRVAVLALGLLGATGCGEAEAPPAAEAPPVAAPAHLPLAAPDGLVEVLGRDVSLEGRDLVLQLEGGAISIPYLSGHLSPVPGGDLVDLESPASFTVTLDALELVIPEQTLRHALFQPPGGAALSFRELTLRTAGDAVLLEGRTAPLGLPFAFRAVPGVTPRGALGLRLEKVRVLGVGVRRFLGAFEQPIERAANARGPVLAVDADWLVLDPFASVGPPEVRARFTSVEVSADAIVARLGALTAREEESGSPGFVLSGGVVRSGKAVLFDATVHVVAFDGGALVLNPTTMDAQVAGSVVQLTPDGDATVYLLAPGAPAVDLRR